jgi:hypothetical protein
MSLVPSSAGLRDLDVQPVNTLAPAELLKKKRLGHAKTPKAKLARLLGAISISSDYHGYMAEVAVEAWRMMVD